LAEGKKNIQPALMGTGKLQKKGNLSSERQVILNFSDHFPGRFIFQLNFLKGTPFKRIFNLWNPI